MIVYHVDMHRHLSPGMILDLNNRWISPDGMTVLLRRASEILFPGGISSFGARILSKPESDHDAFQQSLEIQLELIRRQHFPHLPSRFCSVYASRSVAAARKWTELLSPDATSLPVFALECDIVYSADAHLLDFPPTQSYRPDSYPVAMVPKHFAYWASFQRLLPEISECMEDSRLPPRQKEELLLPPPVRVLYRVD